MAIVTQWDKDSIPGIDVKIKVKGIVIANLFSCQFDDKTETEPQFSFGRKGIHATGKGTRTIIGKLHAYVMDETNLNAFCVATGDEDLIAKVENKEPVSLGEFNKYGGIDIDYEYIDKADNNAVYKQKIEGVIFDEIDSGMGVDILKQEEVITFRAVNVIGFRKIVGGDE